jgi:hypothetical protein
MRTTPERITFLAPNEIFVFGSNYAGRHGKGAAKDAIRFGARWGQGDGLSGQTYGIPTKGYKLEILPLHYIRIAVERFLRRAAASPEFTFLVTPIGCGLAGYSPKDIAPMFKDSPPNVVLPESFLRVLGKLEPSKT